MYFMWTSSTVFSVKLVWTYCCVLLIFLGAHVGHYSGEMSDSESDPDVKKTTASIITPHQRGHFKAQFTIAISALQQSMAERRNTDEVAACLPKCRNTYEACIEACVAFNDQPSESNNIDTNLEYMEAISRKYIECVSKAHAYMDKLAQPPNPSPPTHPTPPPTTQTDMLPAQLERMIDMMSLPDTPLETFDGQNILEFSDWLSIFDERVHSRNVNNIVKLNKLLHATEGEAYELIRHCKGMGGSEGYKMARSILKENYDDPDSVTATIIENLKGGGKVTEPLEYAQLAADLRSAASILARHGRMSELQNQCVIKTVVKRLPVRIIKRWCNRVFDAKFSDEKVDGKYPEFEEFVKFITRISRERRDKTWGDLDEFIAKESQGEYSKDSYSTSSFNTGAVARPCLACRGDCQYLTRCTSFLKMTPAERVGFARSKHLCFVCLNCSDHIASKCPDTKYKCSLCSGNHSKFLHRSIDGQWRAKKEEKSEQVKSNPGHDEEPKEPLAATMCQHRTRDGQQCRTCVLLPIVSIHIPGKQSPEYALLDRGSMVTTISQSLVEELQLGKTPSNITLDGIMGRGEVTEQVDITIQSNQNNQKVKLTNVLVVPKIAARHPDTKIELEDYPHLQDLSEVISSIPQHARARMIIGQDKANLLIPYETRTHEDIGKNILFAERTFLGWAIQGPMAQDKDTGTKKTTLKLSCNNIGLSSLNDQIEKMWHIEVDESKNHNLTPNDKKVLEMWDQKSEFKDGHWHVPIPWKDGKPNFENNLFIAKHMLFALIKRLKRENQKEEYDKAVQKLIDKGYIEEVPQEELYLQDGTVRYLSHFPGKPTKDGKIRIIMDAKHQIKGVSLNNQCLTGPNYVNNLLHVMLRFRRYEYILEGDVEGMYLNVRLFPEDRRSLRFLWPDKDGRLIHYQYTGHIFGGIASGSAAGYILHRICLENEVSELMKTTIKKDFYVDDQASSFKTKEEVRQVLEEGRKLFKDNGFNVKEIVTNVPEIAEEIQDEYKAPAIVDFSNDVISKTLGARLDIKSDQFMYINQPEVDCQPVTQRLVLSKVHTMFDPLGLITPIIITGRMIFQDITRLKIGWDAIAPNDIAETWNTWMQSLEELPKYRFDRCLIPSDFVDGPSELIHFADASLKAYGACTYIRTISPKTGEIRVKLIMSRGRVAPLRELSIPRLELCGAVEAARLDVLLREQLGVDIVQSTFFIDSQIALCYIRNEEKRFPVFIANRTGEIRRASKESQWHYIESKSNPADVITHGCQGNNLPELWINGPEFISKYKSEWNLQENQTEVPLEEEADPILGFTIGCSNAPLLRMMANFSDYYKLKKAVAWLLRLVRLIQFKELTKGPLLVKELRQAEQALIKEVQLTYFRKEIERLKEGKPVLKSSCLAKWDPQLHEGIVVIGGRLRHSKSLQEHAKHRPVLPHQAPIARMIMEDYHKAGHTGVEWTMSMLNEFYLIIGARKAIKGIRKRCNKCKALHGRTAEQKMSDLPVERCTAFEKPFTYTGVDIFGTFYVRQGRAEIKRYGQLMTCFNTRAVHLELIPRLDTDSFLNGFARFVARRGKPKKMCSDNGTNIVGGYNELLKAWDEINKVKVGQAARKLDIEWDFNTPLASHEGGVYERMIRTVRRVLEGMISRYTRLTDDVLQTLFCQVEYIVNSRPITKVSDDPLDASALCPNQLLILGGHAAFPVGAFSDTDKFRRQWRYTQYLADEFWNRWLKEYLPMLNERQIWQNLKQNLKEGDLVLVLDQSVPRYCWPLGLVTEVRRSRTDGLVRSVELRSQGRLMVRPITKVVLLEGALEAGQD